ncbi:MAG: tyrosine-protein phosphatase [Candidatus Melainabacteria bacterium]|nr:tyrosine-protein phosphatase [Candidatus Melainabacteria bacterium]
MKPSLFECYSAFGSISKLLILILSISIGSADPATAKKNDPGNQQAAPVSVDIPGTASSDVPGSTSTSSSEVAPKLRAPINPNELTVPILRSLASHPGDVPNLRMVSGRLLRGGQPTEAGLSLLKQSGVKTIINLRAEEPKLIEQEKKSAERLGLKFISIPLYAFDQPNTKQFQQFLNGVADNSPVYVHCLHGRDRTGTMIGAYRIMMENWTFDSAFKEMMACGFRPGLTPLTRGLHELAKSKGDKSPMPSASFVAADLKSRFQLFAKQHPRLKSLDNGSSDPSSAGGY